MNKRAFSTLLLTLVAVPFAYGKGPVDLIVISGGGLNQPIEISDALSLNQFNPWDGKFAGWNPASLVDAPCFRRSMEVMFYLKWPERQATAFDRGDLKMIYATRYCSNGASGYVYLPGPGEPLYRNNVSTIIRGAADGKWHAATPEWDSLMSSAVTMRNQEAVADMMVISGGELNHPLDITDPQLLSKFDPWTGLFVNWKIPARMGSCNWEYEITYFKRGTGFKKQAEPATPDDRAGFRPIYGVRYCMGNASEPGYVHLAGRTDKFWDQNVHVVWDGTQAGEWHPSTAAWKEFIAREVNAQVRSARASNP